MSSKISAADLPSGATLTILADPVQVAPAGVADFTDAVAGQNLSPGDVVRTGDTGIALLTFYDGSESQLGGGAQLQIEQADYTPAPQIALYQSSGVSVNRVIPLPPGGSFRTDTPDATGLVRGTSYVVTVANDQDAAGTAVTLLTDRDGHVGHVQVVPPTTSTLISSLPAEAIVDLVHAGDLASASVAAGATKPVASHLQVAALARLEQAAKNLHDTATARDASDQARQTLRNVVPAPLAISRVDAPARLGDPSAAPKDATPSSRDDPPAPPKADTTSATRSDAAPDATHPNLSLETAPKQTLPPSKPATSAPPAPPVAPPPSAPSKPAPSPVSAPPSAPSKPHSSDSDKPGDQSH